MTEPIIRILKKHNLKVAVRNKNGIFGLIRSDKSRTPNENKNGIYRIPFIGENDKEGVYIGMTERMFKQRKKEHEADIRLSRNLTALARKNRNENINIQFENAKIIAPFGSKKVALLRETVEIIAAGETACNDSISTYVPYIWGNEIKKSCKRKKVEPNNANQ